MPFQQQQDEPLDQVANIRLTATEKAELREQAAAAGLTISQYGRRRMFGRRVVAQSDAAVLRELRRLGGLLKHLHNQGGLNARETAQTLHAIQMYAKRLAHDHDRQKDQT